MAMPEPVIVDWDFRPRAVRRMPSGRIIREIGPSPRGGQWTYTPAVPNQLITADFYNATQQNIINNFTPDRMDDHSSTIAEMQAETNPYPGGAPSQATTLSGEIERLRYAIHQLNPSAPAWYAVTGGGINPASLILPNNVFLQSYRADQVTKERLIGMAPDTTIWIAPDQSSRNLNIGNADTWIRPLGLVILSSGKPLYQLRPDGTTWQHLIGIGTGNECHINYGNVPGSIMYLNAGQVHALNTTFARFGYNIPSGAGIRFELASSDQTSSGLAELSFHRPNKSIWTIGQDSNNNFVFADAFGVQGTGKFFITPSGQISIPQGQWIYGGARPMMMFNGTDTLIGGYAGSTIITTPAQVQGILGVGGNLVIQEGMFFQFSGGAQIAFMSGGAAYMCRNINTVFNDLGGGSAFMGPVQFNKYVEGLDSVVGKNLYTRNEIYKTGAGPAYTYPDYIFEHAYTGRIEKFIEGQGAREYPGLLDLHEVEEHVAQNWRLPHHVRDENNAMFRRADEMLAELERLYLYLFQHEKRISNLERGFIKR